MGSALALITLVAALRILYLAFLSPYSLIEDETNYWEWSRHLSLSYYTKGPGIAWSIWVAMRVLGESAFAIRMIAVLAAAVGAFCVAGLTRDLTLGLEPHSPRSGRTAFWAAAIYLLVPEFQALSIIATIDGPYIACWAAAAWAGWRVLTRRTWGSWLVFGAALGVGVLYKYTMLMFLPGWVYLWCAMRRHNPESRREQIAPALAALTLFLVLIAPIIVWNHQHHWPTLRHLLGHLHLAGGDQPVTQGQGRGWHYNPGWTLGYIGTQLALAGPMLLLVWTGWREARARRMEDTGRWRAAGYCITLSLPLFVLYFVVSFVTNPQANWAVASFITLCPLAAMAVPPRLAGSPGPRSAARHALNATIMIGVVTGLGMLRLDWVARLPLIGPKVPIWRITGAPEMAAHAAEIADAMQRETGREPFLIALHYGRASQLAFYMPGRPTVYCCSSLLLDGRVNPYDFWRDTDLRILGTAGGGGPLLGRDAVMVGASAADWAPLFERVELIGTLRGDGKRERPALRGYGFRGFPIGGLRSPGAPEALIP